MKDIFLEEMVNAQMDAYKTAFEEGRKAGFQEGYLEGINECKEIVDKTFSHKESKK